MSVAELVNKGDQIPFDTYFKVDALAVYHRVMLMNDFMEELAPKIWPKGNRTVFCYRPRYSTSGNDPPSCNAKQGNPFGPFWDNFKIDFDNSEYYEPLNFHEYDASNWNKRYPASDWPVLAFTGAPGAFPVSVDNAKLHKYLQWSDNIASKAERVIAKHLVRPYIGAHLRIGSDWENACKHVSDERQSHLFASAQCLGPKYDKGMLTKEMCLPSEKTVVNNLKTLVKKYKAKSVYLARDNSKYDRVVTEALDKMKVSYYWLETDDPHLDLAILGLADHYICNCVSTFSAFATRERNTKGLETSFWAFEPKSKDEL